MPNKRVSKHRSQAGQQTNVNYYKILNNYKHLIIYDDTISKEIKSIYENNSWDLKHYLTIYRNITTK
jgi:hypothetical protein